MGILTALHFRRTSLSET